MYVKGCKDICLNLSGTFRELPYGDQFLPVLSCTMPRTICQYAIVILCLEKAYISYYCCSLILVSNHSSSESTSAVPKMDAKSWEADRAYHESLVSNSSHDTDRQLNVHQVEIQTTPLFSAEVLACVKGPKLRIPLAVDVLPSYSFLAKILDKYDGHDQQDTDDVQAPDSDERGVVARLDGQSYGTKTDDSRLFLNMNAPWSAFICGSQGSGKSHTLSCMLEAALKDSRLGKLPNPLAGMVFHYDKFTGLGKSQICEASYLISAGIPVTVLVSSSNFYRMQGIYKDLPKLPSNAPKPKVAPLLLEQKHLNIERMMKLMAVDEKEGKMSLYMEVSAGKKSC